jgi:hypothetical protein
MGCHGRSTMTRWCDGITWCLQDWDAQQKAKREKTQNRLLAGKDPDESSSSGDESDDEGELPFACLLCRTCVSALLPHPEYGFFDGHQDDDAVGHLSLCSFPGLDGSAHIAAASRTAFEYSRWRLCRPWAECDGPPVKTLCEHYFCEPCALSRNAESTKCAVCEKPTQGIFNAAPDVERKFELVSAGQGARAGKFAAAEGGGGGWQTEEPP